MLESESSRTADLEMILASKAVDGDRDRAALARAEEELSRTRREAEKAEKALVKLKAATNSAAATGTVAADPELQEERDKLYVRRLARPLAVHFCRWLTLAITCSNPVHPPLLDLFFAPPVSLHHQVHAQSVAPPASPHFLAASNDARSVSALSLLQGLHRLAHLDPPTQVSGLQPRFCRLRRVSGTSGTG